LNSIRLRSARSVLSKRLRMLPQRLKRPDLLLRSPEKSVKLQLRVKRKLRRRLRLPRLSIRQLS